MSYKRNWSQFVLDQAHFAVEPNLSMRGGEVPIYLTTEPVIPHDQPTVFICIFQRGDIKSKTVEIWKKSLIKIGYTDVETKYDLRATHLVLSANCTRDKLTEWLHGAQLPETVQLVTAEWVISLIESAGSSSLELKRFCHPLSLDHDVDETLSARACVNASIEVKEESTTILKTVDKGKFACVRSGDSRRSTQSNALIISKLHELQGIYEVEGDQWRALSYKKACALLGGMKSITSIEQLRGIRGIGPSLLDKIREIIETGGGLTKLSNLNSRSDLSAKLVFNKIWGVGPKKATELLQLGYTSIMDLRERGLSDLTGPQRIGLQRYEDLDGRMSREEAGEISRVVLEEVALISPGMDGVTCGSYRRGKASCGDVDVLLCSPGCGVLRTGDSPESHITRSCTEILVQLLEKLRDVFFLTDDLSLPNKDSSSGKASYMGVCRLSKPGSIHRRIDIKIYPRESFGSALLYFTGSDHFNRSMRSYADKCGFKLTDEGLWKCHTIGSGVSKKRHIEYKVECITEKDIFRALDLPYKEPYERDCVDIFEESVPDETHTIIDHTARYSEDEFTSDQF